jgi:hypothetical protein
MLIYSRIDSSACLDLLALSGNFGFWHRLRIETALRLRIWEKLEHRDLLTLENDLRSSQDDLNGATMALHGVEVDINATKGAVDLSQSFQSRGHSRSKWLLRIRAVSALGCGVAGSNRSSATSVISASL